MKKLIFIFLLASCSTSDHGVQTVKTIDGLKVKTTSISGDIYPEYQKGDTVIIWRSLEARNSNWYISLIDTDVYESNLTECKKGVIQ
jgi:hypothetical protein